MVPAPASTVRASLTAFRALGLDPAQLRAEAGISEEAVAEPLGVLPLAAFSALWDAAARLDPGPDLPVRAGLAVPLGAIPLLEPLVDTAPTVGGALQTLADRFYLASVAIGVEVIDSGLIGSPREVRFRTQVGLPRFVAAEAWAATIVLARLRAVLPDGAPDLVERVDLPEAVVAGGMCADLLGVPVRPSDDGATLVVGQEAWAAPLRTADVVAHAVFETAADHLGGRRRTATLTEAVAHILPSALARGAATVPEVAARLGYAPRSLQRRLADEGTSFSTLLDGHRHTEARRLLATTALALSDVAAELGYAEQATLTRAFRRWEGEGPLRWRRAQRHRGGQEVGLRGP